MRKIQFVNEFIRAGVLCAFAAAVSQAAVLSEVSATADTIVIGTVTTRSESPSSVSFDLTIERVLKGSTPLGVIHVSHEWRRGGIYIGPGIIPAQLRGIWCLQRTASGTWDVTVVRGPDGIMGSLFWPASTILPVAYESFATKSLLDTLTVEVAAGIESEGLPPEEMIGATGSVNTPALQTVFVRFLNSPSPGFRSVGLAGMLWGGQQGTIAQLVRTWPSISTDPTRSHVLAALRDAFRDPEPGSVQQLTQLADARSTSAELRSAAVTALAAIHTKETLPFLASLLRSADPAEQARGVFGISSFANGCPSQTRDNVASMEYLRFKNPSPYRTGETEANFAFGGNNIQAGDPLLSRLVSFWLDWWNKNNAALI